MTLGTPTTQVHRIHPASGHFIPGCRHRRTSSILCKHHFFAHLLLDVIDNSTNSVISIEGSLHLKLLHKVIEA